MAVYIEGYETPGFTVHLLEKYRWYDSTWYEMYVLYQYLTNINGPEGHFSLPGILLSKIPEMIENFSLSTPTDKMLVHESEKYQ